MNCAVHSQNQAVAFCRTCGKALCEDCKRDVMGAIYCEPCIAARLQGQPSVAAGAVAPPPMPQPVVAAPGTPSPTIAALCGLIPGVGAMYNGQFMKAFAHVVIFILLIFASDHISSLFGMGIAFWVFYMAFEAYKTAEARRLGLPAPDPLGLDKMFGLQESQTPAAATYVGAPANPAVAAPVASVTPVQVAPPPPPAQDNAPIGAVVLIAL